MSAWKFKTVQKTREVIILHFFETSHEEWGDTMSVTIPAPEAQKLLAELQSTLRKTANR